MTRTGQAAIDYARGRVGETMPDTGLCLQFTRQCFAVDSYYYSAIDAWNAAIWPHPGDRHPPPAVPVYFLSASVYDHVAFNVDAGSEVVSTWSDDINHYDGLEAMERAYGPYLGWAEDINGVRVWDPPAPEGDEFLMALTDEQQTSLYNEVMNLRGWVWAGGPDVDAGAAHPATVAGRTINVDRQVTGAQGFTPSVAERVINIEQDTTVIEDVVTGGEPSALSRVGLVVGVAVLLALILWWTRGITDAGVGGAAAVIGGLLSLVLRPRRVRRHRGVTS
jgi:hypothetical protein